MTNSLAHMKVNIYQFGFIISTVYEDWNIWHRVDLFIIAIFQLIAEVILQTLSPLCII